MERWSTKCSMGAPIRTSRTAASTRRCSMASSRGPSLLQAQTGLAEGVASCTALSPSAGGRQGKKGGVRSGASGISERPTSAPKRGSLQRSSSIWRPPTRADRQSRSRGTPSGPGASPPAPAAGSSRQGGAPAVGAPASASRRSAHGCWRRQARCTGRTSRSTVGTSSRSLTSLPTSSGPARRWRSSMALAVAGQSRALHRSVRRSRRWFRAASPVSSAETQSSRPTTGGPPNISQRLSQPIAAVLMHSSTGAPRSSSWAVQRRSSSITAKSRGGTASEAPSQPTRRQSAGVVRLHSCFRRRGTTWGIRARIATWTKVKPDQCSITSSWPSRRTSALQVVPGSMPKVKRCSSSRSSARSAAR
mmetsp:Transcript_84573/g.261738  ORF Transcript_84573/g.261738 Transcript_84573/m.261738 type:complete len:362 (-) Transcript_84573:293-1378(-)